MRLNICHYGGEQADSIKAANEPENAISTEKINAARGDQRGNKEGRKM
jgi:hypothetical protein